MNVTPLDKGLQTLDMQLPEGVFFVKREAEPLPEDFKELLNHMTCGDIHPNSLEHFCALVEEVMVPILKNEANLAKFPQCIADGRKNVR